MLEDMTQIDFIDWSGGPMPVAPGTLVLTRHRNFGQRASIAGEGYATRWEHKGEVDDIVAYACGAQTIETVTAAFNAFSRFADKEVKLHVGVVAPEVGYQDRVAAAHHALFHDDPTDIAERVARFFEEATETCQAFGLDFADAHQLVNYTYDRPVGEPAKEIGAAMLTLTSLCVVAGYNLMECAEADLEKLQRPETIARIRAKRSTRHGRGPLPGIDPALAQPGEADAKCPICAEPFKDDDLCASDITEGTCHAACLDGCPVVDLETGEPSDGPISTYLWSEVR